MPEPRDLSAVEARRLIAARELSPVELLEACIARIEAVNPALNAMVATCYERAREEAKVAEAKAARGEKLGLLHGLPIGVKDLNNTAGLRTTYGSLIFEDNVPAADERLVAVLREQGGIVLGKTNTPEFGAGANTVNRVYGATRNPFDTARTCGGSSGGSAVALATGMVPICNGGDTGGSLRTPAGFCGVTSIRTTPGVVPSERRVVGLSTYGVQGPMARNVPDATLMLAAMAGDNGCDPMAAPLDPSEFITPEEVDLGELEVAVSTDLGFASVDNEIRGIFAERVSAFRSAFKSCDERDPDMRHASEVFWYIRGVHFLAAQSDNYERNRELLDRNVVTNVEAAQQMTAAQIGWAVAEQTRIYRRFQRFFDDHDVLICPTCAVPPFPVEELYCSHINGEPLDSYIQWVDLTAGITLTGHPVAQIPCGRDHTGTPFGLQVVGPRLHADAFTIGVAAALERYFQDKTELARPLPDIEALSSGA